jgi:hypothetical protein
MTKGMCGVVLAAGELDGDALPGVAGEVERALGVAAVVVEVGVAGEGGQHGAG